MSTSSSEPLAIHEVVFTDADGTWRILTPTSSDYRPYQHGSGFLTAKFIFIGTVQGVAAVEAHLDEDAGGEVWTIPMSSITRIVSNRSLLIGRPMG